MKEVKVEGEEVKKEETETTVVEGEEQENKDPDIFYKKDDFFDAISCEALLRAKGSVRGHLGYFKFKAKNLCSFQTHGSS